MLLMFLSLQSLRPTIPKNIHPKLVDLLNRCWKTEPADRPEFSEITLMLQEILKEVFLSYSNSIIRSKTPEAQQECPDSIKA